MANLYYSIKPDSGRVLTSELLLLLLLAIVLYFAVWLNLFLLNIQFDLFIHFIIVVVLAVLIGVQVYLKYKKTAKITYYVYDDRLVEQTKTSRYIMYNAVSRTALKRNLLDKIFRTGTVILEPNFKLKAIKDCKHTFEYLQQLVQYHRQNI